MRALNAALQLSYKCGVIFVQITAEQRITTYKTGLCAAENGAQLLSAKSCNVQMGL